MLEEVDAEIVEEEHLSNPEAYELLKKVVDRIVEREGTVSQLLSKTLKYLSKFSKMSPETARALKKKLERYGLKTETIVVLINVCPGSIGELRELLDPEERGKFEGEVLEEVLEALRDGCREGGMEQS